MRPKIAVVMVFLALILTGCGQHQEDDQIADTVRLIERETPMLLQGLRRNQSVPSSAEFDAIDHIARYADVHRIVYLDKFWQVRYYKHIFWTKEYGNIKLDEEALQRAWKSHLPVQVPIKTWTELTELIVPLLYKGKVEGLIVLDYRPITDGRRLIDEDHRGFAPISW